MLSGYTNGIELYCTCSFEILYVTLAGKMYTCIYKCIYTAYNFCRLSNILLFYVTAN